MNKRQLNTLTMFQAVLAHMDNFPQSWNKLPPVTPLVEGLRSDINKLHTQLKQQEANSTVGHTLNKDLHFDKLRERIYQLSLKLRAFAKLRQDNVLLVEVNYSPSQLDSMSTAVLLQRCYTIVELANTYLPDLTNFNIAGQDIADITALIKAAEPMPSQRDVIAGTRKMVTSTIPELFVHAKAQLDILDDLVEGLVTDSTFTETYFNLRRVNDRVGRGVAKE
ncbi:hypothetical protein [Chitinophaga vietnamensis]|uniref:hypothetical protein n=1 Tax=Chitinophaga vietnamensis TaxID=2593957 RepID=UPI001178A77C|nr:hypothetical protein [Chitinophaga vietnamensis]